MSDSTKRIRTAELHVYLEPEVYAELHAAAKLHGITMSKFVRAAIEQSIAVDRLFTKGSK